MMPPKKRKYRSSKLFTTTDLFARMQFSLEMDMFVRIVFILQFLGLVYLTVVIEKVGLEVQWLRGSFQVTV